MLSYLIVSGLCLLLLLQIIFKVWQNAIEIHITTDNLNESRDLAARRQEAARDSQRSASRTGGLESLPPKHCDVWVTKR
jgi:hypothetical protein